MLLQLQRQPRVAEQDGGAGAVRAEPAHGLDAGIGHALMPAEAQIVLGREVDALPRGGGDVGDGGVRAIRPLQGAGVGPQAELGAALDEVVEALGALEQVGPGRIAEVRQRLVQDARPIRRAQLGD